MTDKEKFITFFDDQKVPYGELDRKRWNVFDWPVPDTWDTALGVGQGFFVFDKEGTFLGVVQQTPYQFFPAESVEVPSKK